MRVSLMRCSYFGAAALGVVALLFTLVGAAGAEAPTTTETWYFHPAQTFTTSSEVTHGFTYKTAVRPPIKTDGSSNWPAKRGVIPVQFDLLAAPTTTTTTTKTYDPPVWHSLQSDGSVSYATALFAKCTRLCASQGHA